MGVFSVAFGAASLGVVGVLASQQLHWRFGELVSAGIAIVGIAAGAVMVIVGVVRSSIQLLS